MYSAVEDFSTSTTLSSKRSEVDSEKGGTRRFNYTPAVNDPSEIKQFIFPNLSSTVVTAAAPRQFICDICGKRFFMSRALKIHISKVHRVQSLGPMAPAMSPAFFNTQRLLKRHLTQMHKLNELIQAPDLSHCSDTPHSKNEHVALNKAETISTESISRLTSDSILHNNNLVDSKNSAVFENGEFSFNRSDEFSQIKPTKPNASKSQVSSAPNGAPVFQCSYCSKKFSLMRALSIHLTKMHRKHPRGEIFPPVGTTHSNPPPDIYRAVPCTPSQSVKIAKCDSENFLSGTPSKECSTEDPIEINHLTNQCSAVPPLVIRLSSDPCELFIFSFLCLTACPCLSLSSSWFFL
ncbi:unnamed protein product [Protopolystoma xenopodis]|uniref:C2H2-type domain-containing protein n=1 Tax=Protopolystoma xenopodis TaxID=117903 RepID=A0A448XJF1_9PLAT|nr:unnamed protein product [Protopolystoma xenopodis]